MSTNNSLLLACGRWCVFLQCFKAFFAPGEDCPTPTEATRYTGTLKSECIVYTGLQIVRVHGKQVALEKLEIISSRYRETWLSINLKEESLFVSISFVWFV